jgi:hypothetical protein
MRSRVLGPHLLSAAPSRRQAESIPDDVVTVIARRNVLEARDCRLDRNAGEKFGVNPGAIGRSVSSEEIAGDDAGGLSATLP